MVTLLKWTLLRLVRRRHPELFDPVQALASVDAQINELA